MLPRFSHRHQWYQSTGGYRPLLPDQFSPTKNAYSRSWPVATAVSFVTRLDLSQSVVRPLGHSTYLGWGGAERATTALVVDTRVHSLRQWVYTAKVVSPIHDQCLPPDSGGGWDGAPTKLDTNATGATAPKYSGTHPRCTGNDGTI